MDPLVAVQGIKRSTSKYGVDMMFLGLMSRHVDILVSNFEFLLGY